MALKEEGRDQESVPHLDEIAGACKNTRTVVWRKCKLGYLVLSRRHREEKEEGA